MTMHYIITHTDTLTPRWWRRRDTEFETLNRWWSLTTCHVRLFPCHLYDIHSISSSIMIVKMLLINPRIESAVLKDKEKLQWPSKTLRPLSRICSKHESFIRHQTIWSVLERQRLRYRTRFFVVPTIVGRSCSRLCKLSTVKVPMYNTSVKSMKLVKRILSIGLLTILHLYTKTEFNA